MKLTSYIRSYECPQETIEGAIELFGMCKDMDFTVPGKVGMGDVDKTIKDEEINHNYNFFDCIDVNNDNKRDITASVFSQQWNDYDNNRGVPEVYINADDHYYNLDTSNWPTYSDNQDTQGYLFDIDMSGTLDLVIFPTKVNSSSKVEIYTTNKNLTD